MLGKLIIGLIAVAIVTVAPTVSASAKQKTTQQKPTVSATTEQKKITVSIPKQVCEKLTVDTENWGEQTVRLCGPPGGPRGQAMIKRHRTQKQMIR
jgi:uncharacterized protein YcfJ